MQTVAVIGAGVVGASIAYRLATLGAQVWIIDQGQPGSGTTSTSFAWINANRKTPRPYFDLNAAGMAEHQRLANELSPTPWLHPDGNLVWTDDPAAQLELATRIERLRKWGYAVHQMPAANVNAELEPHIAFPTPKTMVALFPDEGWADAPLLTQTLVDRAIQHGAEARFGATIATIEPDGPHTIRLHGGERITVDAIVNAAGTGAAKVAALLGPPLPLAPTVGLLLDISVEGNPLNRIMHAPAINARPNGPGRLLLHHDSIDAELGVRTHIEPNDPLCQTLLERAQQVIPSLQSAIVARARIGVRPITADGLPSVGPVSAMPGYYEAVTHSGVTLGPIIGRLLAHEILTGEVDPLIAPFRSDRFPRS